MNDAQKLWWEQAKSDHAIFVLLRRAIRRLLQGAATRIEFQ